MIQFIWRKPYLRKVENEGVVDYAIVTYEKKPHWTNFNERTGIASITQWRKRLTIDLLLVVLRFEWLTRVKSQ